MADTRHTLLLIDGHALAYRMFFALEGSGLTAPDGTAIWAVYGFFNVLLQVLQQVRPQAMAVAFDVGRETFRNEIYAEYKAHREAMPDTMRVQMARLVAGVEALGVPIYQIEGYEADDVIGSISRCVLHNHPDWDVRILTGDQDSLQLVEDGRIHVLMPSRNPREGLKEYDSAAVVAKLGVRPDQVPDFKALKGDPSDNIPGVPGVGDKTAGKLLTAFDTVPALYERLPEVTPDKLREKLTTYKDQALMSLDLATIRHEVPGLTFDLEACHLPNARRDPQEAEAGILDFLDAQGFRSWRQKRSQWAPFFLAGGVGGGAGSTPSPQPSAQHRAAEPHQGQTLPLFSTTSAADPDAEPGAGGDVSGLAGTVFEPPFDLIQDLPTLTHWLATHGTVGNVVAIDVETTGLDPFTAQPLGFSLCALPRDVLSWQPRHHRHEAIENTEPVETFELVAGPTAFAPAQLRACYVPLAPSDGAQLSWTDVLPVMTPYLLDPDRLLVAHNAKYEIQCLAQWGIDLFAKGYDPALKAHLSATTDWVFPPVFDTMVASYVLRPETRHGLKALAGEVLNLTMRPFEELVGSGRKMRSFAEVPLAQAAVYGATDAWVTMHLAVTFTQQLPDDQRYLLYGVELPFVWCIAEMERQGVALDVDHLASLSRQMRAEMATLEEQMHAMAGLPFNPNSPKQVAEVLFERLGLAPSRKTDKKTGYSTDQKVLEQLADAHPMVSLLLRWRQLSKLVSTYVDVLPTLRRPKTNRVHTSFNQTVTATGRLSSSEPNLQNIPIRTEAGRAIRQAFVPDAPDRAEVLSADYSQIELRLLAHYAQEPVLLAAFAQGEDIHARTAATLFGLADVSQVSKDQRAVGKTVNFGVIYGQTAHGLSEQLRIPRDEAQRFIDTYFSQFPGIRDFIESVKAQARQTGLTHTLLGRVRNLSNDLQSRNRAVREFAERAAFNTPLQGTAADLMKLAMNRLLLGVLSGGYRSRLVLQVHDEIVMDANRDELPALRDLVRSALSLNQPLRVPLDVDVQEGPTWLDA